MELVRRKVAGEAVGHSQALEGDTGPVKDIGLAGERLGAVVEEDNRRTVLANHMERVVEGDKPVVDIGLVEDSLLGEDTAVGSA